MARLLGLPQLAHLSRVQARLSSTSTKFLSPEFLAHYAQERPQFGFSGLGEARVSEL